MEGKRGGRAFIMGGIFLGALLSAWYLYRAFGGVTVVPDPVWLRLVKVALIMFCSIYGANLLRRLLGRGKKGAGP